MREKLRLYALAIGLRKFGGKVFPLKKKKSLIRLHSNTLDFFFLSSSPSSSSFLRIGNFRKSFGLYQNRYSISSRHYEREEKSYDSSFSRIDSIKFLRGNPRRERERERLHCCPRALLNINRKIKSDTRDITFNYIYICTSDGIGFDYTIRLRNGK